MIIEMWPGRGGRVAEGAALEKRYPVKNGIVGSNPTLSAIHKTGRGNR